MRGLKVFPELRTRGGGGPLLARLAAPVTAGRLDGHVREVLPWEQAPNAARRLLEGGVGGKLVLHVG